MSLLKRRAKTLLNLSSSVDDPGLALFLIEQSLQLYTKAVYYELFGERLRGHGLRELLGVLANSLGKAGLRDKAEELKMFVLSNRYALALLEEAYTMGRYGMHLYSLDDVNMCRSVAEKLIKLLDEAVKNAKLG